MGVQTAKLGTGEMGALLHRLETQLAELQRLARVGTWDYDPRSGELNWSEPLYRFMGVSDDFVPTLESYLALVHPDDRAYTARAIRSSLATGSDYTVMHRILIEKSSPAMLLCRGSVEMGPDGTPVRMAGVSIDLSDLQHSAELHRAKHEQLEAAEELTGLGSFEWDIGGDRVTWSDGLYRIFGFRPGEFDGTFEAYLELVHQDEREERKALILGLLREGEAVRATHRIVRPSGELRYVDAHIRVLRDVDGAPVRIIGACQDVTEREQGAPS